MSELEKCKDNLKHCYHKRINQKKSTRWPKLGDPTLYVDVTIVRAKCLSERFREEYAMKMTQCHYPYVAMDELLKDGYGKVVLIEGDPGSGKTTFIFRICQEWAKGKVLMEDIVFWIPLRHYKSATTTSELFDKLDYPEIMGYAQQNNGKGLVLLLDGWDELPDYLQAASLFHDIIFGRINMFTRSTIIVTSRPSCSGEIAEAVEETKSYYQILGFDYQKAMTYIKAYFHNDSSSGELLLTLLNTNEHLSQHFYIPISVTIMCFVYRSDGKQIPQTLSKLYERFVLLCLRSNVPDASVQDLKNFKTLYDIPEKMRSAFHNLCKIAFNMLKDNKLVLSKEEVEIIQDDVDTQKLKQSDGFGLLHIDHYTTTLATMETSYSFIHRCIQELLAAIFISNTGRISDELDKHFYKASYLTNIFPFLFGIVSKDLLRPLAGKLIQIFIKSGEDCYFLNSILFCLFEAHDEALSCEFAKNFSRRITFTLQTLLDCHYACYFITVCGIQRLSVCLYFFPGLPVDVCSKIVSKYLYNTSADIAYFDCDFSIEIDCDLPICQALSHKGMEQLAKALSTQHNILSVKLKAASPPDSGSGASILCDSIRMHNPQISELELYINLNENDLEAIGSLLTMNLSLESLHLYCFPCIGACDLPMSFCKALCETKSLHTLVLTCWELSQANIKVFGNVLSHNCSLKELGIVVDDCLDPILDALSSNTSIARFQVNLSKTAAKNTSRQFLQKCFALNHSMNVIKFGFVSWSSTQVSSICTGLCANSTVVTLDISRCYIDTEACHAVCSMLTQNKTLQHLFLNPVQLQKQEAIALLDSCRANETLEVLSLIHFHTYKDPFHYSHDHEIEHVLLKIQNLRQEKDKALLNVYWLVADIDIDVLLYNHHCIHIGKHVMSLVKFAPRYFLP